ncbi:alkaline phosphatase PhoX [Quadrisphaera sp. GCM10027208]|uniref:alkaline phosphatase PhoX n=1 Tax=Quadrisphaera sp. GCM10027208 TaxID=3273423 RepID=UPI00360B801D
MFKPALAAGAAGVALLGMAAPAAANGPFDVEPISGSAYADQTAEWTEPFVVPDTCTQRLVADETVLDIYPGVDDLTDMNTLNETGKYAGRYLYRTHEVGSNGSLSVVDLRTGEAKVLVQDEGYRRLDGLRWTPWGTLLFAEETAGGRLFEAFLDPKDPSQVLRVEERPEVGIMRHEGIGVDEQGSVYVIDELNGGSIYRFVPTTRGDLSDGQLYALRLTDLAEDEQEYAEETAVLADRVGPYEWVPLDMATAVVDAEQAADDVNATGFGRPEDVELIGNTLYVANTTEDRVVAIDLKTEVLTTFVGAGVNVPVEDRATATTGFNGPDNLASSTNGQLFIVEDNVPSDIWVASKHDKSTSGVADDVELFASLKDPGAEGTGIYFGKDPRTLYVNVQHPAKPEADGTWAITCR